MKISDAVERYCRSNGQKPPEFLSTHPADSTRIAGIRSYLPEAMYYYQQNQSAPPEQSQPAQQQNTGWQTIIQ